MPEYRRRTAAGELNYKPRLLNDRAQHLRLPSRDPSRPIRCRLFTPASYGPVKGVMLHIHGGGYTVFGSDFQDPLLAHIADTSCLAVVSVEYRLAPEHPFPQGPEDCYDVAEWLAANAKLHYGAELSFIAGSVST
jgi:acetyl esterase/lipase